MHNTSHVEDEPYPKLLQEKGFGGFPSLCFMDADGNVLIKQGDRSVAGFQKTLDQLSERAELAKKAKAGDAKAEKQLFLVDLGLGTLSAEEIQAKAKKLTLSKEEQRQVDAALTDVEVSGIAAKSRQLGPDKANEQVAEIAKSGRRPSQAQAYRFWTMTLQYAAKEKDAKLGEQAYAELEKVIGDDKRYARVKPQLRKLLDEAQGK